MVYQLENSFFNSFSVFSVFGTVGWELENCPLKYTEETNIVFFSYIIGCVYLNKHR